MIVYRNRVIFGLIGMIISTVFHAVYAVISLFKLQYALLVAVLWVILYLFGIPEKYPIANLLLSLALIISVLYSIISILKALLGFGGKKKRRRGAEVIRTPKKSTAEPETIAEQPQPQSVTAQTVGAQNQYLSNACTDNALESEGYSQARQKEQPKYYRVKQNSELVMAEYSDRYELYKISGGSLVKIRTDFKDYGEKR